MENLIIDKTIGTSLLGTAPQINRKVCTQLLKNTDSNSTELSCSKLSEIEAQLCGLKLCELRNIFFAFYRSSRPEVFLGGFLKICSKFTGEHPCRSVISSIKLFMQLY